MRLAVTLFVLSIFLSAGAFAQAERNMLIRAYSEEFLKANLSDSVIQEQYPGYRDRKKWDSVDPAYRTQLIADGEATLDYKWQTVPATTYLEFVKSGNRMIMEDIYNMNVAALKKLVFAELAEGKERFVPQIINGVWALCEVSSWSISASIGLQKAGPGLPDVQEPIVELGAGITSNALAWTYYLFNKTFDKYSPMISKRIKLEIEKRILTPYYTRNDFWWMALDGKTRMVNNWNVWLNYNVLTCLLLVEDNEEKKIAGVYKTMRSVDKFINYYKDDGGCEEGPSYWSHAGGMLFNYLSLLNQATQGRVDLFSEPLIRNIASYIGKAYIDSTWFLNYADADANMTADAGLVYHFGKAVNDTALTGFGAYLARQQGWNKQVPVETMYGALRNIFSAGAMLTTPACRPFIGQSWMEGTGIAIARDEEGSSRGFYFSALAGHNGESHNHNDVGTCVLFCNGEPMLIDVGSEIYTSKTFSPERYTIWTMRSAYHNVPLINGVEQTEGRQYSSRNPVFRSNPSFARFNVDIAAAYPATAAVKKWRRTYELNRKQSFTITDHYQLLSNNGNTSLHFMTCAAVTNKKDGLLQLTMGNSRVELQYNPKQLEYSIETITIKDKRLLKSWGPAIYRLVFKWKDVQSTKGEQRIIFRNAS